MGPTHAGHHADLHGARSVVIWCHHARRRRPQCASSIRFDFVSEGCDLACALALQAELATGTRLAQLLGGIWAQTLCWSGWLFADAGQVGQ